MGGLGHGRGVRWLKLLAVVLCALAVMGQGRGPWRARRRPGLRPNFVLTDRVEVADWPREPDSPRGALDVERFARALHELCRSWRADRERPWADHIARYSQQFEVDPFLVGALVYRESRCDSNAEGLDGTSALGLTQIPRDVYAEEVRGGHLHYHVRAAGSLVERTIPVADFPFGGPRLLMAEPNLYYAAALLHMWQDQHETVDASFDQIEHRHFVSHFIWGDRVRSDWEEERILSDRRRLLEYYGAHAGAGVIDWHGVALGCPLDGCPRAILSWLGEEREGGVREHRGIDLDSLPGEPVRAVAPGFVYFAGVDLPGHLEHVQVGHGEDWDRYPRGELGAGGRYVCIRHGTGETPSLRSCYMHLETVELAYGDHVERGALVGTVGRTGMRTSAAHLHFELTSDDGLEDPSRIMAGLLLGRRPDPARVRR
jgi:hypothetical protein